MSGKAATEVSQEQLTALQAEAQPVLARYRRALHKLDMALQKDLSAVGKKLKDLGDEVDNAAEAFDPELPDRPEPEVKPPDESGWLFDVDRDYLTQLGYYHAHRDGKAQPEVDDVA